MSLEKRTLVLFDVDGTLAESRVVATEEMKQFLKELQTKVDVGIVGGSDLPKQQEQLGPMFHYELDYTFSENGLVAYQKGALISKDTISNFLGEEKTKEVVNFLLRYIADLELPVKRGTFIDFRSGLLNNRIDFINFSFFLYLLIKR